MSEYPEHDKLTAISEQSQVCGEFIEWLQSRGVQLMTWREDLTDQRETYPECKVRFDSDSPAACDQVRAVDDDGWPSAWWRRHCFHWQDANLEATESAVAGHCCRCRKGRFYEIHNVRSWTAPDKNLVGLLAEFFDIDQDKIEAEKRAMLKNLQKMAAAS